MSFPRYAEYKDSGVEWLGEVPGHWDAYPGRRLFMQIREQVNPNDEQLSATQKYGVIPQKLFMEQEDQKVTLALSGLENFKHVEVNDFVISLRSFQGGIERSKYIGCVSPAYTVLRPTLTINGMFFGYLFKSDGYIIALQSVTDGIRDGKNISYEQFGILALPIPPLPEQHAIAAFLDRETGKIDGLVAEQEKLIVLLKEKRQAVISHAVTKGLNPDASMKDSGIEWLGMVPEHWDVSKIRRVAVWVQTGGTPSTELPSEDVEDGIPWFTPGDFGDTLILDSSAKQVTQSTIRSGDAKQFPPGCVLIVSIGATLGKVGFSRMLASANQQINAVYPTNRVDSYFLAYSLSVKSSEMRFLSNASTIGIMNQEKTKEIFIVVPPLQEQSAIVTYLDQQTAKIDSLISEAQRAIDLLKERRTALISAAVTGKIDVRELTAKEH